MSATDETSVAELLAQARAQLTRVEPGQVAHAIGAGAVLVDIRYEGYQSSLAAATRRRFGVDATDVIGGFRAWREAGLPISR